MKRCIYCQKLYSVANLCDEHIISACLGATEVLDSSACRACNSTLGKTIEAYLSNELQYFRNILNIPARNGKVPSYSNKHAIAWGKKAHVTRDSEGNWRFEHPIDMGTEQSDDGTITRTFRVPSDDKKKMEKLEDDYRRKFPDGKSEVVTYPHLETVIESEGTFNFIKDCATRRCVTKYAYCFLAQFRGINFIKVPEFDFARRFILDSDSTTDQIAHIIYSPYIFKRLNVPIPDHAILLCADNVQGYLVAVVVILGMFYYLVELSSKYKGPDWYLTKIFTPWARKSDFPPINSGTFFTHIPIREIIREETVNPRVWPEAINYAVEKLNNNINPKLVKPARYFIR